MDYMDLDVCSPRKAVKKADIDSDCPSASQAALRNMLKLIAWIYNNSLYNHN